MEMPAGVLSNLATTVTQHGALGSNPEGDQAKDNNSTKEGWGKRLYRRLGWKAKQDPSNEPIRPINAQYGTILYPKGLNSSDQPVKFVNEARVLEVSSQIREKRDLVKQNLLDGSLSNADRRLNDIRQNNWLIQKLLGDPLKKIDGNPLFITIYEYMRRELRDRNQDTGDPIFINNVLAVYEDAIAKGLTRGQFDDGRYQPLDILQTISIKSVSFRNDGQYLEIFKEVQDQRRFENQDNIIDSLLPKFRVIKSSEPDSDEQKAAIDEIIETLSEAGVDVVGNNFILIWAALETSTNQQGSEQDKIKRAILLEGIDQAERKYIDRLFDERLKTRLVAAAPASPDSPTTPDVSISTDERYPLPNILENVDILTNMDDLNVLRQLVPEIASMSFSEIQKGVILANRSRVTQSRNEFWLLVVSIGQDSDIVADHPGTRRIVYEQYSSFIKLLAQDPEYRSILESVSDAPNPDIQNTGYYWSLPESEKREEIANSLDRCYRASEIYIQKLKDGMLGLPDFLEGYRELNGIRAVTNRIEGEEKIEQIRSTIGDLFSSGRINDPDFRETVQQVLRSLVASGGRLNNRNLNPSQLSERTGDNEVITQPGSIRFWQEVNQLYWRDFGHRLANSNGDPLPDPEPLTPDELRNDFQVDVQVYRLAAQDPVFRALISNPANAYNPADPEHKRLMDAILTRIQGGTLTDPTVSELALGLFRCNRALSTYLDQEINPQFNFAEPDWIESVNPMTPGEIIANGREELSALTEQILIDRNQSQSYFYNELLGLRNENDLMPHQRIALHEEANRLYDQARLAAQEEAVRRYAENLQNEGRNLTSDQDIRQRVQKRLTDLQLRQSVEDVIGSDELSNQEILNNLDIPAIEATEEYQTLFNEALRALSSEVDLTEIDQREYARRTALQRYLTQIEVGGNRRLTDEQIDQLLQDHTQNNRPEDRFRNYYLNEPDARATIRLNVEEVNSLLNAENQLSPEVLEQAERSISMLAMKSPSFLVQSLKEQGQIITREQAQTIFDQLERTGKIRKITIGSAMRGSYVLV